MTTEALRKLIKVTDWTLTETGLAVSYEREDSTPKTLHLVLNRANTFRELYSVGSIEIYDCEKEIASIDNTWYNFSQVSTMYKMCQWEALAIAIRHEEEKELANDMNMLELDSAINALK